jgi:hypothetical protein
MVKQKSAAADIAGIRVGDRQRKVNGYRSINRITPLREDIDTDLRGVTLSGGHR